LFWNCSWSNFRNYIWKGKTQLLLTSFDKQLLGQVAAKLEVS
jgi:ribosomal protein L6P/L9E